MVAAVGIQGLGEERWAVKVMNGCGERGDGRKQKVDNDGSEVAVEMILAHRERVIRSGIQLNGGRFSLVDFSVA